MKKITPLTISLIFLILLSSGAAAVTYSQDKYIVERNEEFTWRLNGFENKVTDVTVISPGGINVDERKFSEDSVNITFDVNEAETGVHTVGVRITEGTGGISMPVTYFTSVGVNLAPRTTLDYYVEDLRDEINSTEDRLTVQISQLRRKSKALKENLTEMHRRYKKLKNKTQYLETKLEKSEQKISNLKGNTSTGITGDLLQKGSAILGVVLLILLGAYIAYEKLQSGEEEKVKVEEGPKDFSP